MRRSRKTRVRVGNDWLDLSWVDHQFSTKVSFGLSTAANDQSKSYSYPNLITDFWNYN
jgi:hypothetical protein